MALGEPFRRRPVSFLNRPRRSSPVNQFSIPHPFAKPRQPGVASPEPGPIRFKPAPLQPTPGPTPQSNPVSTPLAPPLQSGLSRIQSELVQNKPTSFDLPAYSGPS